jgi:hypothetical protein
VAVLLPGSGGASRPVAKGLPKAKQFAFFANCFSPRASTEIAASGPSTSAIAGGVPRISVHFLNDRPRSVEELDTETHCDSTFSCAMT